MSRSTYTDAERHLLKDLSIRKTQVLKKLARLMGADDAATQQVPLEDLIGKDCDDHDRRMILKTVTTMRSIIEAAWLRQGALFVKFRPEARSLIRKMALQAHAYPPRGDGVAYCEAALALKRAMGVRSEVWYTQDFDFESFNYGEDTEYLETAFENDSWCMSFEEDRGEFLQNEVMIRPVPGGRIQIDQSVCCQWPSCDLHSSQRLALVPAGEFLDPESWAKLLPGMAAQGRELVEKVNARIRGLLEVKLDNGAVLSRPEILRRMEEACREKDALCQLFGLSPEVRPSPEWPLGQEPRAWYREYSCSLAEFLEQHREGAGRSLRCAVEDFAGSLWLAIFEKKFGIRVDPTDLEDYGPCGVAERFQERFQDKAAEIEAEYRRKLENATARFAWGLSTEDFKRVSGFVNGVLSHPALGKKELKHIGWSFDVTDMRPDALRKSLDDAVRDALSPS